MPKINKDADRGLEHKVTNGASSPQTLLAALRNPQCYPHAVRSVEILETHISWVVLTGTYAYKIKKPVNLGFLNFTSLDARHRYCEEEVRLNRRLAPEIYLGTVSINGSRTKPVINGAGEVIEYAVAMREFPQTALLDAALARGVLDATSVHVLGETIAAFHANTSSTAKIDGMDPSALARDHAMDNFRQMLPLLNAVDEIQALDALRDWSSREYERVSPLIEIRVSAGAIRECHGDLHLANIALIDDTPTPFDCVEFSPQLRWIDVMSEAAFLTMDFEAHARSDLAYGFLNSYLENGGDYDGVSALRFYLVYRALVRAKINLIRARQFGPPSEQYDLALNAYHRYRTLASRYTTVSRGVIIITHGLSGSGKTTLTQALFVQLAAIRVRSDLERKRLHGRSALARTGAELGKGIYSHDETTRTYAQLARHARSISSAGIPAIIDATFLKRKYRNIFRGLAQELGVPFFIISVQAPHEVLRARVAARSERGTDASEATIAVLDRQIAFYEPLSGDELRNSIVVDASRATAHNVAEIRTKLGSRVHPCESNS